MFGYGFPQLSEEQKHERRVQLDAHANYAQLSYLCVFALIYIFNSLSHKLLVGVTQRWWSKVRWWAGEPVIRGWGTKGEWAVAAIWTSWTMLLCVRNTGDGECAASTTIIFSL
jgi:hypothetical protein